MLQGQALGRGAQETRQPGPCLLQVGSSPVWAPVLLACRLVSVSVCAQERAVQRCPSTPLEAKCWLLDPEDMKVCPLKEQGICFDKCKQDPSE